MPSRRPGFPRPLESGIDVTSLGDRPMRALISFTLQRNLHANMRRTRLLSYSPQPACSSWPAGFISPCFYSSKVFSQQNGQIQIGCTCIIVCVLMYIYVPSRPALLSIRKDSYPQSSRNCWLWCSYTRRDHNGHSPLRTLQPAKRGRRFSPTLCPL